MSTSDGGFLICGSSRVNNEIGTRSGFLMKLDSNGEYEWFRRYQPNTCDTGEEEDTYIYGVSELRDGGFALCGRYICDGRQELVTDAIVVITDKFGCIEPGCEKLVSVQKLSLNPIKIVTNPSNGSFHLTTNDANQISEIKVIDMQGREVKSKIEKRSESISLQIDAVPGL